MSATAQRLPDGTFRVSCNICAHIIVENAVAPERYASLIAKHEKQECPAVRTPDLWLFDNPVTRRFTEDRMEFLTPLLRELRKTIGINSALDVGCGLGDFSNFVSEFGIPNVRGVDGRAENIAEAQRRHPSANFQVADAEELPETLAADLVLCFGLLYHLENPFRAIRRLHAVTGKLLLLESICVPAKQPRFELMDEGVGPNQGLNYVALYPSESGLVKMLYRSGFPFIYGFDALPKNVFYRPTRWRKRLRTMLLASTVELSLSGLCLRTDVVRRAFPEREPWGTLWARMFPRRS